MTKNRLTNLGISVTALFFSFGNLDYFYDHGYDCDISYRRNEKSRSSSNRGHNNNDNNNNNISLFAFGFITTTAPIITTLPCAQRNHRRHHRQRQQQQQQRRRRSRKEHQKQQLEVLSLQLIPDPELLCPSSFTTLLLSVSDAGGGRGLNNISNNININNEQQQSLHALLFWVTAFASSHIGMSAIRQNLIQDVFGKFLADNVLGIVGNKNLKLPDYWPGDSSSPTSSSSSSSSSIHVDGNGNSKGNGNALFPDIETTGRQFYRIFYTIVSFLTLGKSFSIYLSVNNLKDNNNNNNGITDFIGGSAWNDNNSIIIITCYVVATLSGAFSLASLVNASPLGLMPAFRRKEKNNLTTMLTNEESTTTTTTTIAPGDTVMGIARDDDLKFEPKGLTRITRHPLILPVVSWGMSTSILVGGQTQDYVLFGGLALYAIVGCYCQDLRVIREEGSVGTVFVFDNDIDIDDYNTMADTMTKTKNHKLSNFYNETSFVPFGAVFDGRQSWKKVLEEFPILPFFLFGIPASFIIETILLQFLDNSYTN